MAECNENTCLTFSCHGILYEPFYWYELKYTFFQSYEDEFVKYEEEAGTNNPMWTLRISKDNSERLEEIREAIENDYVNEEDENYEHMCWNYLRDAVGDEIRRRYEDRSDMYESILNNFSDSPVFMTLSDEIQNNSRCTVTLEQPYVRTTRTFRGGVRKAICWFGTRLVYTKDKEENIVTPFRSWYDEFYGSSDGDSDDSSSDDEEKDLRDLLEAIPKGGQPKVGKVYTLDEFRGLETMNSPTYMYDKDTIPKNEVDCDFDNTSAKSEPVIVWVQRIRHGNRQLRMKFEWDKQGTGKAPYYVFCASALREWLKQKMPDYMSLYDTNPFNKKEIYKVKYLTQKEATEEWTKRKRAEGVEKRKANAKKKSGDTKPQPDFRSMMVNRFQVMIEDNTKELDVLKSPDSIKKEIASTVRDMNKLKEEYEKNLQKLAGMKTQRNLNDDYDIMEEVERLNNKISTLKTREAHLNKLLENNSFLESEIKRIETRISQLESQVTRLTPNIPNTQMSNKMENLKF